MVKTAIVNVTMNAISKMAKQSRTASVMLLMFKVHTMFRLLT
jgi:hypothetical protein